MHSRFVALGTTLALGALAQPLLGEGHKDRIASLVDARQARSTEVAKQIWDWAEVGYQEERSSALLRSELEGAGFQVEVGVAGMPTAFVASYGRGKPVVGILAEFDALPGLAQQAVPRFLPIEGQRAGHGCGHHLFGTASTGAAIAVKQWLSSTGTEGTIRLFGTPAEEGGAGKVYMVRKGLFDDVDAVLTWHAGGVNDASPQTTLANKSAKFRFHGHSAHAARAPEQARSALDGLEAMNYMVNLMREHVPQETRIHYVITDGGHAPNVVPNFAEAFYYCRHPDAEVVKALFERIVAAAEGAAQGTGTRVEFELIHGTYNKNPNLRLHQLLDANLRRVGGFEYTPEELVFAEEIRKTLPDKSLPIGSQEGVQAFVSGLSSVSADTGDVSWVAPTGSMVAATWVPGTPSHSWQATSTGGMSIGFKGMNIASKTLAMTAVDLYTNPEHVAKAQAELREAQGPDFVYTPLIGTRPPPLDYRQ